MREYSKYYLKNQDEQFFDKCTEVIKDVLKCYLATELFKPLNFTGVSRSYNHLTIDFAEFFAKNFGYDPKLVVSYFSKYNFITDLDNYFKEENITISKNLVLNENAKIDIFFYRDDEDDEF